ncbi:hypothetical protein ACFSSA_12320, partial [Luteolibacter algae]
YKPQPTVKARLPSGGWCAMTFARKMPASPSSEEPTVLIHGSEWKTKDIAEAVEWCLTQTWHCETWKPTAALVQKSGTVSQYRGQKFDPDKIGLVKDGWTHDHCEICWWTLRESNDAADGVGYRNETNGWICTECFNHFVRDQSPNEKLKANKAQHPTA